MGSQGHNEATTSPPVPLRRPLLTEASAFPRASPELLAVVPRVPVGTEVSPMLCLHDRTAPPTHSK